MLGKLVRTVLGFAVTIFVLGALLIRYFPGVALIVPADWGRFYNSSRIFLSKILPDITFQQITDWISGLFALIGVTAKASNQALDGAAAVARNENALPGFIGVLAFLLFVFIVINLYQTWKSGGLYAILAAPFGFFKNLSQDKFWVVLLGLVGFILLVTSGLSIFWTGSDSFAKQQAGVMLLIVAVLYFGYEAIDEYVRQASGTLGIFVIVGLLVLGVLGGLLGLSTIQPVINGATDLISQGVNFLFQIPMAIVRLIQGLQTQVLLFGIGLGMVLAAYVAKDFGHSESGPAMMAVMPGKKK